MFWKKLELVQKKKLKYQNNLKKKILIISGGISKERIISLETGKEVAKELIKNGYNAKTCEPDYKLLDTFPVELLRLSWLLGL